MMNNRYLMMNDGYLIHHGVKGMKWGVRKDERFITKSTNRHASQIKKLKSQEYVKLKRAKTDAHRKSIKDAYYKKRVTVGKSYINDIRKTSIDPYKDLYSSNFRNSLTKSGKEYVDDLILVSTEHVQYLKK